MPRKREKEKAPEDRSPPGAFLWFYFAASKRRFTSSQLITLKKEPI